MPDNKPEASKFSAGNQPPFRFAITTPNYPLSLTMDVKSEIANLRAGVTLIEALLQNFVARIPRHSKSAGFLS